MILSVLILTCIPIGCSWFLRRSEAPERAHCGSRRATFPVDLSDSSGCIDRRADLVAGNNGEAA